MLISKLCFREKHKTLPLTLPTMEGGGRKGRGEAGGGRERAEEGKGRGEASGGKGAEVEGLSEVALVTRSRRWSG